MDARQLDPVLSAEWRKKNWDFWYLGGYFLCVRCILREHLFGPRPPVDRNIRKIPVNHRNICRREGVTERGSHRVERINACEDRRATRRAFPRESLRINAHLFFCFRFLRIIRHNRSRKMILFMHVQL